MATPKRQTEWGWLKALALFLEGLCGATIVLGLLLVGTLGVLAGAIAGILAGLVLLVEAGNPRAAIWLFRGLGHSWMSRGTLLITLCILFGLAYALPSVPVFAWLPWSPAGIEGKILGGIAGLAGLLLTLYPGMLLGSMKPFPMWRAGVLGPLFLVGSFIAALGLSLATAPASGILERVAALYTAAAVAVVFQLLALWAYVDSSFRSSATAAFGASLLLRMPLFLWGVIVFGLVVPLAMLLIPLVAPSQPPWVLSGLAGVLMLVGQLFLRYAVLASGVRVPLQPSRI